ncbi:hypothetical protein [Streptomyces sp. PTD5-9]|uniref:hypothetical protein n=1 Tax=Streptomyces sp. PTD5-9 TaxID=3120150 RepID=UPI0030088849
MSAGLLAATEPRRTRGGAGGVRFNRPRRRSEQTVWIPEALFVGAHFNDEAVTVYAKVAALDARRSFPGASLDTDPCTASVAELATACGISPSAVERGLTHLNRPGPDGAEPWLHTKQRTHTGGRGRSAKRYARLVPRTEAALEVPVRVAEALTPRRLRAYLHLARATAKGLPVTGAELAGELFHHTGKNAGQPLSQKTGYRLLNELDALGWLTLDRRGGQRGRHAVTVNTHPLHLAPTTGQPGADNHDGVAPDNHDGSLASREDTSLTPDVVAQAGSGIRRRRGTGSKTVRPVENPVSAPATFRGAGQDEKRSNNGGGTDSGYTGPGLQLSPRVWHVLEPVRHELPGIRPYVLRRIAHEIGRQLSQGAGTERLTARLTARWASTEAPRRGDVGRWILGAGLVRRGCGLPSCESGTTWHTGAPCPVCHDNAMHRLQEEAVRAQQQPADRPQQPVPPAQPPRPPATPPAPAAPRPGPTALPAPAGGTWPALPRAEREQLRAAATPQLVRQAIAEHGRSGATYLYGHALVLPHLAALDTEGAPA